MNDLRTPRAWSRREKEKTEERERESRRARLCVTGGAGEVSGDVRSLSCKGRQGKGVDGKSVED